MRTSVQLFFEVTAKNAAASWWTCLAPHVGQAIFPPLI